MSARALIAGAALLAIVTSVASAAPAPSLQQVMRSLLDRQEIERLQYMLGYYQDNADWQAAAALFDDAAVFEVDGEGSYAGRERIAQRLRADGDGPQRGRLSQAILLQPVISIDADGRTARARFRALEMRGVFGQQARWGEGIYENAYVKRNGVWKVSSVRYYRTFLADFAGGWTEGALPLPGPRADLPPDRPPTRPQPVFPEPVIVPFHRPATP